MSDQEPPPTAPGEWPVVGHTVPMLRAPLDALQRWGRTEEGIVRLTVTGQQFALVTDPGATKAILATGADGYRKAAIVRDRLGRLQGGSLVLLEGDEWAKRRQLLQPAFSGEAVRAAGPLTTAAATRMVDQWPTGQPVRADKQLRTLSLSILARALFGLELRGERTPIHEAADDILARLDPRSLSAYLPEWVPTPRNYRFRRAVATLHDRIDSLVTDAAADGPGHNLLSVMLAAGLDADRIRDELIALLFAGYDSTATALSATVGLLGEHPQVQAALRTELEETLGGQQPTPATLDELPLLDAVVRESLRLYPPQYILFREPVGSRTVRGYQLDPGTTVVLSPWVSQRSPRFWDAPDQFRPDRWREGAPATDRPEFAYFPYGGGPRHCLGRRLAAQTIRLVVATVCQRRQLQLQGSLSVTAGPTLSLDAVELRTFRDTEA